MGTENGKKGDLGLLLLIERSAVFFFFLKCNKGMLHFGEREPYSSIFQDTEEIFM